ncbi:MAG: hypothetical protein H6733_12120 [Alphaproteobacteria bacterium]|nr:hypothetical protein [Alphaproteobacteria bacterium]
MPTTAPTAASTTPGWERPVLSRYLDPLELVWLATARRLGITLRRDPSIFSRTDGSGTLWLGPRDDLDADDTLCQMLLHELCHWITNGVDAFTAQDWGFPLDDADDPREFACLRLQAWLADTHGLRGMLGPTGKYREYYDRLGPDALAPLDDSATEATVVQLAHAAVARVQQPPFHPHVAQAMTATAALRDVVAPFLDSYATELDDDELPSLWAAQGP